MRGGISVSLWLWKVFELNRGVRDMKLQLEVMCGCVAAC